MCKGGPGEACATSLKSDVVNPSSYPVLKGNLSYGVVELEEEDLKISEIKILVNNNTHAGLSTPQLAEIGATPAAGFGARPAATPVVVVLDSWDDLPDPDAEFAALAAAAGTSGLARDTAPHSPPTAAPRGPQEASGDPEALLARLRELVRGEALAWLPQRPAGDVDVAAVRRDVAAVAAAGATMARLAEVVAAARPAGGEARPWRWVINTLRRNPAQAPASAGGARRAGRPRVEVRPDRIDPTARATIKQRGW